MPFIADFAAIEAGRRNQANARYVIKRNRTTPPARAAGGFPAEYTADAASTRSCA
jgi:hypothetical protein